MPSIQNFISDVELGQFEHLLGLLLEGATVCEQENILLILLSFITRFATFPYVIRMTEEQIQKDADLQTIMLETIRGARAVKIFGREQERHAHWQNAYADSVNVGLRLQRFGISAGAGSGIIFA